MNRSSYERLSRCSAAAATSSHQRLQHGDLQGLREAELKEEPVRKLLAAIRHELGALFGSLFFVQPKKVNSMCKYYGHVIRGPWQGFLPKCADCGCTINGADELRKAVSGSAAK